ncbi:MAG: helix-turn-helix domain-containing protein [Flavobacteriia bacterium]|nr:helix-turn-helix domain-containing protein [Flavobacteriia bacterium]OIP47491.1 MAG: DNA-binding protein [Flavobacteriaceae bacterium CG2_30_31_66]PIV95653.1 MAG: DNA-binding protein [Flavobacteriaceae bacterium CG17_big_fil_post_rev_8_21_14_2_50_31_13]PIX12596.1 MAG: DNA-binding protein [Flavobacteriaceae bacterium CG_4_8_14_3_um_filter_31_8]PIY14144.1 MAG: DNA-binding protein [Flavobacteriaceae bacterium CG_4_10_14_3_um_filter_31_253]PIZ09397.1 MAG: DNA-binding protein [Flavobacteriaceae 
MSIEILTKDDLFQFKNELLEDIKKIINSDNTAASKKWLKSKEVIKLLKISPGTLQNLRINGTLTYTKVGGTLYYDNSDIEKLLNTNKTNAIPSLFK